MVESESFPLSLEKIELLSWDYFFSKLFAKMIKTGRKMPKILSLNLPFKQSTLLRVCLLTHGNPWSDLETLPEPHGWSL